MNRFVVAATLSLLASFAIHPAFADLKSDAAACDSKEPAVRIAGCTRLIAGGRVPKAMAWVPYWQRGQGYSMQKRFDEAIADFTRGIAMKPGSALYSNRGSAYQELGNNAAAYADFDRAIQLDPKNFEPLNNKARGLAAEGRFDQALDFYERALKVSPKNTVVVNGRGTAWQGKGDFARALADFDDAIRLDPKYIDPYLNIGVVYMAKGEVDRAMGYVEQVLRLDPSSDRAYNNRAIIYLRKGQMDAALADADKAIALNPKNAHSVVTRGNVLHDKGDYAGAVASFDKALRIDPANVGAFYSRGLAYQKLGDFPRASADFEQVIRFEPDNSTAYAGRALVLSAQGDVKKALENYDRAIQIDPNHAGQFSERGTAREKIGDYDGARADFRASVALPPVHLIRSRGLTSITTDSKKDQDTARARLLVLGEASGPDPAPAVAPVVTKAADAPAAAPSLTKTADAPVREQGRRIALILGNGAYQNANRLPNPANDARVISRNLTEIGFEVSEGIDLGKEALQKQIATFLREAPTAKLVVLFYAGHGMQIDGKNYLVPVDASFDDASSFTKGMLDMDTILAALDGKLTTNIVILDACRDNPLAKEVAATPVASRAIRARSGLAAPSGVGMGETAGAGTMIAFATAPGQVALDGDGSNSPFSAALSRHIATPGLEVQQMMTRVRAEVVASTKGKQVPWSNSALVGEVYLKAN